MSYLKFPLGNQGGGALVRVNLQGVESDVFLVDASNLSSFEHGSSFHYTGGHYKSSPIQLVTPLAGDWTTVVVPSGGQVRATVSVISR